MLTGKELIESGILELYVLGRLSDQEKAAVERMRSRFPEVQAELSKVELAMEAVDRKLAKAPVPASKEKLFREIADAGNPTTRTIAVSKPENSWMLAASVSIAVISLAAAIFFYQKWATASQQYEDLVGQNSVLAGELNQVKNSLDQNEELLAIATDEDIQRITLSPTKEGSDLKVLVYWNAATNEVYLDPGNLTLTGSQQDYQLWAIVEGKPVDMGVISLKDGGSLLNMKPVANAAAFAITLEPKGGRLEPTLEKMIALGKVRA